MVFASNSKMRMAGSGVAVFGSSPRNVAWMLDRRNIHTAAPDKLNQLQQSVF